MKILRRFLIGFNWFPLLARKLISGCLGDVQSVQPIRGMNSPSESKNPPKRIDENIQTISNRFQPISAISPEIDFRVGGDVQAVQPIRGINSPSESKNPPKRIDEDIHTLGSSFYSIDVPS
jgi:hypothetical protein